MGKKILNLMSGKKLVMILSFLMGLNLNVTYAQDSDSTTYNVLNFNAAPIQTAAVTGGYTPPPAPPAPPAPPPTPPVTTPTSGGGPTNELALCESAIVSGLQSKAWSGIILPITETQYGLGWTAEGTIFQWGGRGTEETSDAYYELWANAFGNGLDGVFVGIDNTSAQVLYYGLCVVTPSGSISRVDFEGLQQGCTQGCGVGN